MDQIKAYAKVNIRLEVVGKLPNGYHDLTMVNCKVDFYDTLEIETAHKNQVTFSKDYLNHIDYNYCLYILDEMVEKYHIPHQKIYINKNIPDGAGLGGGSSDAAAIINYLDSKYRLKMSIDEKIALGLKYGSDIPYCLYNCACFVQGSGEIITPINDYFSTIVFLIMPGIHLSTKEVFSKVNHQSKPIEYENVCKLFEANYIEPLMYNDLEPIAFKMNKRLAEIKRILEPYGKASMSGSGSTIFFIPKENYSVEALNELLPDCRIEKCHFLSN